MPHPLAPGDLARCREALAPLRTEPRHAAELGSELLFGEAVYVVEHNPHGWTRVKGQADGYEAWLPTPMLSLAQGLPTGDWPQVQPLTAWADVETGIGRRARVLLARGARFPMLDRITDRFVVRMPELGGTTSTLRLPAEAVGPTRVAEAEAILRHALEYLGAPYRWGGRTVMGIDCSGLTQVVLALHGIQLPRDAWQQAEIGADINRADRMPCDMAFFASQGADSDRITHVGFVLDAHRILHASGLGHVRLDPLSNLGIHRPTLEGPLSHRLIRVKRVLPNP